MKALPLASTGALISILASGVARADPGPHLHPHLVDGYLGAPADPLVQFHPALGFVGVLAFWATTVWAVEALSATRRRRIGSS